jgi:tetratricopeptide (TPR) repeat protein
MRRQGDEKRGKRRDKAVLAAAWLCLIVGVSQAYGQPPRRRSAQSKPPAAFDQLAKRAAEARDANRTTEAIQLYQQGVKTNPSWGEGWWYLGTMFYELERHAEARDALRRLAAVKPDGGPTWAILGLCEFQLREYQPALVHLTRARTLGFGGNEQLAFAANYHTAILLTRFEQYEAGLETLTILSKQYPANPTVVEALGINLLRIPFLPAETPPEKRELVIRMGRAADSAVSNRLDDARREFGSLIQDYSQTPNICYALGVFLLSSAPDEAMEMFRRELQFSPRHAPALLQIAFEYLKRNDHQAGLPFAEQAVQSAPSLFAARNALGRILLELDQTDRAIRELVTGVKLAPDSPEMHFALARAYSRAGRKAEAARARAEFTRLDKIRRSHRENQVGPSTPEGIPGAGPKAGQAPPKPQS